MSDEHYPGEADEAAADEASCMDPMIPHALTREQVEKILCRFGIDIRAEWRGDWKALGYNDAALRQALAQQAQEVERLKREVQQEHERANEYFDLCTHKDTQLAAMTAEVRRLQEELKRYKHD